MTCVKSSTCDNYGKKCRECWSMTDPWNTTPCYVRKNGSVKFKIFYGNHTLQSADEKVNQWLNENPSIRLVEYQYQQARLGDHSICVMYEEN